MNLTQAQWQQLIGELWKSAVFNTRLFEQLTKIAEIEDVQSIPPEVQQQLYYAVTSVRNRNLITDDEQRTLEAAVVGFFGLSVGSHAVTTWLLESRANCLKIIDPDIIDGTNLNRLRLPWSSIGRSKAEVTQEILSAINPQATIIAAREINDTMYQSIFHETPRLAAVVDEIDDLAGKLTLRRLAREAKIPLLSATDVGDNVILDIERYDQDPQPEFFLGKIPGIEKLDPLSLNLVERVGLVLAIVGLEDCSVAMLQSLLDIGEKIETWPQLAATATISGGIITTALKKIFLGELVSSGRYLFSLDQLLTPQVHDQAKKQELIQTLLAKYPCPISV